MTRWVISKSIFDIVSVKDIILLTLKQEVLTMFSCQALNVGDLEGKVMMVQVLCSMHDEWNELQALFLKNCA